MSEKPEAGSIPPAGAEPKGEDERSNPYGCFEDPCQCACHTPPRCSARTGIIGRCSLPQYHHVRFTFPGKFLSWPDLAAAPTPPPAPSGALSEGSAAWACPRLEAVLTDLNIIMGDNDDAPSLERTVSALAEVIRRMRLAEATDPVRRAAFAAQASKNAKANPQPTDKRSGRFVKVSAARAAGKGGGK